MKLTMSLRDLLSTSRSKHRMTCMLAAGLPDHYSDDRAFKLVVAYDIQIKGHGFEEYYSHEHCEKYMCGHLTQMS